MEIIDAHAHLFDISNYEKILLKIMDEYGIKHTILSGLGPMFNNQTNRDVNALIKTNPERFIGAYYIRPGETHKDEIDHAYAHGFRMLKVTLPRAPYDDPSFYPLWERAQDLNLPILFHTGVVTIFQSCPSENISAWNMHPMRLEPLTNAFPNLKIIIAHLGVHWNTDAAELARMRPNVYVDLTGEPNGWRKRADQEGMDKYLWWDGAFKKVIFGTDVIPAKIPIILQQDRERYEKLQLSQETQRLIFGGNIKKLLKLN